MHPAPSVPDGKEDLRVGGFETWQPRSVPQELVTRYVAEGWWTDTSLGDLVAAAVHRNGDRSFRVYSDVRPFAGTCGELDRVARSLAASLRADGVGAGDVVAMQLPNWAEAGVGFWAATYLGAVIVPIVHVYGPKEIDYILRAMTPDVVVTPDHFRAIDYLPIYESLLAAHPQTR